MAKTQEPRPFPRRQPRPLRGPAPARSRPGRLPPLPGLTPWERRLSRFSSFRASRASWATRSSAVAGPPGLGSAAKRAVSRDVASVPDPGPPASEGATRVLSLLQGHCRAMGDPQESQLLPTPAPQPQDTNLRAPAASRPLGHSHQPMFCAPKPAGETQGGDVGMSS